jgi:hypothetical protein
MPTHQKIEPAKPVKIIDFNSLPVTIKREHEVTNFEEAAISAVASIRPSLNRLVTQSSDGQGGRQISRQTMDIYRDRSLALFDDFSRQRGIPFSDTHMPLKEFAEWFIRLQYKISPSTWRSYKAAVLFFLGRMSGDDPALASGIIQAAISGDQAATPDDTDIRGGRVDKSIPFDDFMKIVWECQRSNSENSMKISDFMRAAIRCGLRPMEWASSEIRTFKDEDAHLGRQARLFVCNAKSSNGLVKIYIERYRAV